MEKQIISPSTSKTANGTKQDGLIGGYNLTHPTLKVDWKTAMNLITYTSIEDFSQIPKGQDIPGIKLYSMIIPPKINVKTNDLKVKNGEILEGRINNSALGAKKKTTLTQYIWDEYGVEMTENFCDDTRWLNNNFNLWHGFSVGYGDIEKKHEIKVQIDNMFETKKLEVQYLVTEIENNPDLMSKDLMELKIYNLLKGTNEEGDKLISSNLSEKNAFKIMMASGAKGGASNLGQMMGCLGLQAFEGKIMPTKYNNRTLPYFHQNDDTSESRGLVRSCFHDGLDFVEFFYQTVNGRSGLIDQAVKTATTGYMQRKLIKSFEDIMIKYDGTVRNANNSIVQYVYGDSGADTIAQFEYDIQFLEMDNANIEKTHIFSDQELKNISGFSSKDNQELFENYKAMRNHVIKCVRKAKLDYLAKIKTFLLPVNFNRLIELRKEKKSDKKDLTPKYILNKIEDLLSNEKTPLVCMTKKERQDKKSYKYQDEQYHKVIFRTALYDAFSPKKIIIDYSWDKEIFDDITDEISRLFEKNIVEPGEMVGVIAASATGEPLTQMNLSSFHQAGVSRTNANNMGVPRMSEIFSVSKNPKAPEMKIYLNKDIRGKKEIYHKIKSNLKHTIFSEIRKRITVYYDPSPNIKEGMTKKDNIIPYAFSKNTSKTSCQSDISNLPYLIRVEVDREKMAEKEIKLVDIVAQFCNWWEMRYVEAKNIRKEEKRVMNKITSLAVLANSDNDIEQIIHIRFNAKDNDKDKFDLNTINDFIEHVLDKFKLKGIDDIVDIPTFPEDKVVVFDEESGEFKTEKEFVIITSGVNLTEIRYINGIDINKTITNNIVEMYNTFGIEIARALLFTEISMAYSAAGGEVNPQHIEIIVDQMTMTGSINSIDRHGLSKSDADPLSRASFEKPVEQLWKAALFGEVDNMNGVSSRVMAGLCIKGGTGYPELILNTEMIENADFEESEYDKKYEEIKTENITADIVKKAENDEDENVFMPM